MPLWKKTIPLEQQAGLLLGYELTSHQFKPVLDAASKGERGWKYPMFLKTLVRDPSPLLLHKRWVYDAGAVEKSLEYLQASDATGVAKLRYVFEHSKRFDRVVLQDDLADDDSIAVIMRTMEDCTDNGFSEAIAPLGRAYGVYAYPSNFEFERMNAGIISALTKKRENLRIMDDALRSPVYEYLLKKRDTQLAPEMTTLKQLISSVRKVLIPLPSVGVDWDPDRFVKICKSQGAEQLRAVVGDPKLQRASPDAVTAWVTQMHESAREMSPTREVVYALGSLGGGVLSLLQVATNPLFWIPTAVFLGFGGHQAYMTIKSRLQAADVEWLDLAKELAALVQEGTGTDPEEKG